MSAVLAEVATSSCFRCKAVKSISDFYKGNKSDGTSSYCRECCDSSSKEQVARVRQEARELSKSWIGTQPGRCRGVVNLGQWTSTRSRCTRRTTVDGYCLTHASEEARDVSRRTRPILAGRAPFGSEAYRKRLRDDNAALMEVFQADPEFAALFSEQEHDAKYGSYNVGRWQVSLDADWYEDRSGHDVIGIGSRFLSGYATDEWTEVVHAVVDRRREIDAWAEEEAA